MHRKTLLASALAVLIAGSTSFVMAQSTPTPPPSKAHTTINKDARAMRGNRHAGMRQHGARQHGARHQRSGVISDLRSLDRLYMQAGRSKEMAAVYNDVLTKSQDPRVRSYVYQRLARLQAQPANVDQAIATLRKGLSENLANDAKRYTEREKMRAAWQQRAEKAAPATN